MINMTGGINRIKQSRTSVAVYLLLSMIFLVFLAAMIVPYVLALLISGILALSASPANKFLPEEKYDPTAAVLVVAL
jgi:hypothetical protein